MWYNKYVSVFSSGLVSQPSFVNFESSCCLMLAIDQLRRRWVTSKNNACLSKLLQGLGKQVHTSFFLFFKKTIQRFLKSLGTFAINFQISESALFRNCNRLSFSENFYL